VHVSSKNDSRRDTQSYNFNSTKDQYYKSNTQGERVQSTNNRGNRIQKTAYDKKKNWQAFPVKVQNLNQMI
jgi:hypothetical protein